METRASAASMRSSAISVDGKVGIEAAQSQHGVIVERETLRVERRR